jgi:hypothetical protein
MSVNMHKVYLITPIGTTFNIILQNLNALVKQKRAEQAKGFCQSPPAPRENVTWLSE